MTKRGDVVIIQYPYVTGGAGKTRPAVVIQTDRNNGRLQNTIVAMITGNVRLVGVEPTQVLIDSSTSDGRSSGLRFVSAVKCENLFTVGQSDILRKLGSLSPTLLKQVDAALRSSLDL